MTKYYVVAMCACSYGGNRLSLAAVRKLLAKKSGYDAACQKKFTT